MLVGVKRYKEVAGISVNSAAELEIGAMEALKQDECSTYSSSWAIDTPIRQSGQVVILLLGMARPAAGRLCHLRFIRKWWDARTAIHGTDEGAGLDSGDERAEVFVGGQKTL